MALDKDKIDDASLALLYLTLHDGYRAWKGIDWDVLGRLPAACSLPKTMADCAFGQSALRALNSSAAA